MLKGILTAEDARLALEHGIPAIIVSNHGGRQLDSAVTGMEALPEIVEAVAGRCEVYVDGGIRRGTDVFKALALGTRSVLVGRPVLWGLAVDGTQGVRHVLEILRAELELTMKLAGCPTLANPADKLVGQGFCDLGFIASIALKHPRMKGSDALLQFFAHDLFNQDLDSAHGQATQIEEMKETF